MGIKVAREAQVYESWADVPSAAAYGEGPVWVAGRQYWCDGRYITQPGDVVDLKKWSRAISRVRSNSGNAVLACVGTSITAGCFGNNANDWLNAKSASYPSKLAKELSLLLGITTNVGSVIGDQSVVQHAALGGGGGNTLPIYDGRITHGSSWGVAARSVAGGQDIASVATAISPGNETFTFASDETWDTVIIYWFKASTLGTFTVDFGAGVQATCNNAITAGSGNVSTVLPAGNGLAITTITKAAGVNVINFIRTVAPSVEIFAIRTLNSTVSALEVLNMGWAGSKVQEHISTTAAYNSLSLMQTYAADLYLVELGTNEVLAGLSPGTYKTNLTKLVSYLKTVGDVALIAQTPLRSQYAAEQAEIIAAMYAVSGELGAPIVANFTQKWGAVEDANDYLFSDDVHPVGMGYQNIASVIGQFLAAQR
jgi:hypothetical protein